MSPELASIIFAIGLSIGFALGYGVRAFISYPFRQWTDRGYVHCRAEIPIGLCDHCGSKHWNQEAEAIVEEVARCEYEKLPRRAAMRTDGDPQRE